MNWSKAWIVGVAVACGPVTAEAFAPSKMLAEAQGPATMDGQPLRRHRQLAWRVPPDRREVWARFAASHPGWRAQWNVATGLPHRMFGPGVRVAGASTSAGVGATAARAWIESHRDLLLAGASPDDLVQVTDHFDAVTKIRTVAFEQHHQGLPVADGQLSVAFKNDRLFVVASELVPNLDVAIPAEATWAPVEVVDAKAVDALAGIVGRAQLRTSAGPPMLLPIVPKEGAADIKVVRRVIVDGFGPTSRWSIYVDIATARPLVREQTLRFASGTVRMNVPNRQPSNIRQPVPAPFALVRANNQNLVTDENGVLTWPGTDPITGTLLAEGTQVQTINQAGENAAFTFSLTDGGTVEWDQRDEEFVDAQLNAFIAGGIAWRRALIIAPNNGWLNGARLEANVNFNDSCNAFSDGVTINFFRASRQCENTGRLADVVYHEFGHSFHANSILRGVGSFDGALSEGISDYYAATITNDSGMGRGFFYSNQPLREIDPADDEAVWPDDIANDPHTTGLIIAGALWDLRTLLIEDFPNESDAVQATDRLLYAILQRASDIPSSYVEVLAADDDDGDISNGTPNFCAINDAFGRHGLADTTQSGPPIGAPTLAGRQITVPVFERSVDCPTASVVGVDVFWRDREDTNRQGTVAFVQGATGWTAELPEALPNTVIQYRVTIRLDDGSSLVYPRNPADDLYEAYFGDTETLFCTDFEQDVLAAGWTSELLAGETREGANDWQWGSPVGGNSGDPTSAFSGNSVLGNDLGGGRYNGEYQANITNQVTSPAFDTRGLAVVRLQYRRWLTVEDADFDTATIRSNGRPVWTNFATGNQGNTHHEDREWRFHDVDLSSTIGDDNRVQIAFEISSDGGLEFGGWTIDDLCIVGISAPPEPICGNGMLEPGEACDDGNTVNGDGCEADCTVTPRVPACGDGIVDPGEVCDDGNTADGDGCEANCTVTPDTPPPPTDPCEADPASCDLTTIGDDGCGCTAASRPAPSSSGVALWGLLVAIAVLRRRRS